jgi:hypothetical protein
MKAINILKQLDFEDKKRKYPSVPDFAITPHDYKDKKANGLTRCIIDWIKLNGGQAERINTIGKPVDKTKIYVDVVGFKRRIGNVEWQPSTATKGSADISATIRGRAVKIEVKIGADRQSEHQKKYESDVTSAGGIYYIAKDFQSFYEWYNDMFK